MSELVPPRDLMLLTRRRFLAHAGAAACVGLGVAPDVSQALTAKSRSLSFIHTHTGEKLSIAYCTAGAYEDACLKQVNWLLRDFRTGEVHVIDPKLLDLLHDLQAAANRDAAFEVISGYRSPQTNRVLRKKSSGVAKSSLHMDGRAIDVRLSGFSTRKLRDFALSMQQGGVGFYAQSDFLHIDTGRVRSWEG